MKEFVVGVFDEVALGIGRVALIIGFVVGVRLLIWLLIEAVPVEEVKPAAEMDVEGVVESLRPAHRTSGQPPFPSALARAMAEHEAEMDAKAREPARKGFARELGGSRE